MMQFANIRETNIYAIDIDMQLDTLSNVINQHRQHQVHGAQIKPFDDHAMIWESRRWANTNHEATFDVWSVF